MSHPDSTTPSSGDAPAGSLGRLSMLFLAGIIGVAVIGYFVGLSDGVPQPSGWSNEPLVGYADSDTDATPKESPTEDGQTPGKLIAAVNYSQVPETTMGPTAPWQATEKRLPNSTYDLFAEIVPSEAEKARSSAERSSRRAFNGAPPIVPHAVQDTSDGACYACHSKGLRLGSLKASVMSHDFLANCLQCHSPPPPAPFQAIDASVATSFVGLPAPPKGKRAFPGAPPTIPHSRWMRENCDACHGGPNGWAGMESTHPWRTNCTQCHAPSAALDQAIAVDVPSMLPPIAIAAE